MAAERKKKQRRIPLRITDTTLRDAHQSLWATRMRTEDIMGIIDVIDSVGYYSLEVWGGATFDVCLRFLRENPWERLRQIKARARKTPLQMLLRGQNILGYRNYPDDLLEHFVALACENGVDIFRVFDALNDTRNLAHSIECVKRYGGHAQGTLSYTISPVHTVEAYVQCAREQVGMGIDSLCIKDMAGILSPISAERLVSALCKEIDVPIQLHCHATSGMAAASYVEGVRAGAGAIDCAISPMAGFQSQPPVETMLSVFEEMPYHATLDREALREVDRYFSALKKERTRNTPQPDNTIDPAILHHHIPGGMISNLRSQLKQQNALDRLDEVLTEIPIVRKDLGYPPLVTPTSQIVGTQAVMNVISGKRYEIVSQELKDYVRGLYGKPPAKINPKVKEAILGNEEPITCRPADLLQPILPNATKEIDPGLIHSEEDIISYSLFPETALDYFKWRALPVEERPTPPAHLETRSDKAPVAKDEPVPPPPRESLPLLPEQDYRGLNEIIDKVNDLGLSEFTIRREGVFISVKGSGARSASAPAGQRAATIKRANPPQRGKTVPPKPDRQSAPPAPGKEEKPQPAGPTIDAPVTGTFYAASSAGKPPLVQVGDVVQAGQPVCVVEAMKLFNEVKAPEKCKIVRMLVNPGDHVEKGQAVILVEKTA